MRLRARLLVTTLAAAGMLGPGLATAADRPAATTQPNAVAVGDFLVKYARAVGVPLARDAGPVQAAAELTALGLVAEEVDLSRPLTEGDVVRIASRSGLRLRTMDAGRLFTADRVDPFFQAFSGSLGSGDGQDGAVFEETTCDPDEANCGEGSDRAREKRKKKKDQETPPDP